MTWDGTTIALVIAAVVLIRVFLHFYDKQRIRDEIEARGGRVISISWNPFGRGWFFEKGERLYEVMYRDHAGRTVTTGCKTSLFTSVYWAEGPAITEPARRSFRSRCLGCGYQLNAEWRVCPNCGKAIGQTDAVEPESDTRA